MFCAPATRPVWGDGNGIFGATFWGAFQQGMVLGLWAGSAIVVVSSCLVLVNGMCPGIGKDHSGQRLGLGLQ